VEGDSIAEVLDISGEGFFRAEIPSAPENRIEMRKKGYIFADRRLGVEVNLSRSLVDYTKLVRFELIRTNLIGEEILDIALSSFPSAEDFTYRPSPT
jgi:hypothetical protein